MVKIELAFFIFCCLGAVQELDVKGLAVCFVFGQKGMKPYLYAFIYRYCVDNNND